MLKIHTLPINFWNWVAVVMVMVVHAGSSSMSDCSTARKVRVTKGIQLRTEKDSLELRQEGSTDLKIDNLYKNRGHF